MTAGVLLIYVSSYWAYYQGCLFFGCEPGPRVGLPFFSIDQTVALALLAMVPLVAALNYGWAFRFVAAVSALSVAFSSLTNLIPLPINLALSGVTIDSGPLPYWIPPLTILVVAAGCIVTLIGLGSYGHLDGRKKRLMAGGLSGVFGFGLFYGLAFVGSPPYATVAPLAFTVVAAAAVLVTALVTVSRGSPGPERDLA